MAQFYAINQVTYFAGTILPGTLLDSTKDASSFNAYVGAGGLAVDAGLFGVAAAAAAALSVKQRGGDPRDMETIMRDALDAAQGLGATAGAPANDAVVQKRTVTVGEADLTNAVNGSPQAVNIGAVLPSGAVVLAHEVNVATLFSGGSASAVKLDVGGTTSTAIVNQQDVFTGAATGALSPTTGAHGRGKFSGEQLVATFTPDGAHNLAALTAGALTVSVWFIVAS